jgi:hypothetical protein
VADSVTDEAKDKADEATDSSADPTDKVEDSGENTPTDDDKLFAPLKKAAIAAAVAALTPIVKDAVRNGAESAVRRAPELLENAGGWKGIADLAKDKLGDEGLPGALGKIGRESGRGFGSRGSAEPVAEDELDEEALEEEPVGGEERPEEEDHEEELDEEEELEYDTGREEDLREEPIAEEVPSRTASRKRSSSSARTARRTKSSPSGRRTASSSAARAKRARSQSARGDGAPAAGRGRSETTAGQRGRMSSPYEQRSKDDLEKRAQELGIEGRSKMDKGELIDALRSKSGSGRS